MKIIYTLFISILFGTNPIAAQQVSGAEGPLLAADLVCNAISTPGMQTQGSLELPSILETSPRIDTGSQEPLPGNASAEIETTTITQDSLSQHIDPYQQQELIDPPAIDAFFLYPNPTSGVVQVKLSGRISVLIYTISGQLIKKYALGHGERVLDLTDLPAGIYQVRARSDDDYFSGKLLIQ